MKVLAILGWTVLFQFGVARPHPRQTTNQPYAEVYALRNQSFSSTTSLVVDLGYELYQGSTNSTTGINVWRGIRFAAPPTGSNRWKLPQIPANNRGSVNTANTYGPQCPQSSDSTGPPVQNGVTGDEDCLFLNVYAPANITQPLPVMVWIHGGGYGALNGRQDFTTIINSNNGTFVGVSIQYRLGAFGFLSSQEVFDNGTVNAGIHDQYRALQWVQQYISLFGGDPRRVTVSGESAGGGSVMLLSMAYGGSIGDSLFRSSITASPYLPTQHSFNDPLPTSKYNAFVERAGCANVIGSRLSCLRAAPTEVLQNASSYVSTDGVYGTWAFLPVTDGSLIQDLPSRQLAAGKVNGHYHLTGNNALEGPAFTPSNLTTETDVTNWLKRTFSMLTDADVQTVLQQYPIQDPSITSTSPRFATNGISSPNANEVSPVGAGQQQRAYNIYSETTFVCPSYWLAEAYSRGSNLNNGSVSYKYQYSVIPATHGQDVSGYFSPPRTPHSPDFSLAFQRIWGNFVTTTDPSISNLVANGQSTGNTSTNAASSWPTFNQQTWPMINLNETFTSTVTQNGVVYPGSGIKNDITLVNAYTWEAGRGKRCEFWKSIAAKIPEK